MCKLALAGEYLSADNELMANLLCSVYSMPAPIETVWFRNNQRMLVNKSDAISLAFNQLKISVMVLNQRQEYMLADLAGQPNSNFKCQAQNLFGYSDSCELNQLDRQTLLSEYNHLYFQLIKSSTTINPTNSKILY